MDLLKNLVYSNILRKVTEAVDSKPEYPAPEKKEPPKETAPVSNQEKPRGRTASSSAEKPGS